MTDNFSIIREYMRDLGIVETKDDALKTDLFFDVQLIRRGKDHPDLPSANYTFKTYYFDSIEGFDKSREEIIKCCDMFALRAYVSVNAKSKQEAQKKTLERYAHNVVMGEYRKPWKDFSSVCGGLDGEKKRWIVDIDDVAPDNFIIHEYEKLINLCDGAGERRVIMKMTTKSGVHIITHPFNLKQFYDFCKINMYANPDVKKNHITLLYENL